MEHLITVYSQIIWTPKAQKVTNTNNTDRNGSLKHQQDCQGLDRPTKKCRTETDSLAQVEIDPSRVKENGTRPKFRPKSETGMMTAL